MIYKVCPQCGAGEKAIRQDGRYEYDTNAGGELTIDDRYSCSCELTADEWEAMQLDITDEDFIPDYD